MGRDFLAKKGEQRLYLRTVFLLNFPVDLFVFSDKKSLFLVLQSRV